MDIFEILKSLQKKEETATGSPEWMLVGLGNPGTQYEYTRHNAGFLALDRLAAKHHAKIDRIRFKGLTGQVTLFGKNVLLLKPQTFMNNSGQSVQEAMNFYKLPPERVVILFDDISLPVGHLRLRRKGSDGGHNGLKSIFYLTGSDQFPRVKIGVGAKPHPDYDLADWVLSHFTEDEGKKLEPALDRAGEAASWITDNRMEKAMAQFNGDAAPKPAEPKVE